MDEGTKLALLIGGLGALATGVWWAMRKLAAAQSDNPNSDYDDVDNDDISGAP